jgi:putative OPT family oligopeptide transporter
MDQIDKEEKAWYESVYKGDKIPELTLKVIIVGIILSVILISTNIYMGLKTGFNEGGSILSAILAFALIKTVRGKLSILENNNAQTMASAAASLGIIVSAVPALIILGFDFSATEIFIWILSINILGVLFAIPLRKQFIVIEKLTFPSGTACAETILALHAKGKESLNKAKVLGITSFVSAIITWFRDGIPAIIPYITAFPGKICGYAFGQLTIGLNWSPMLFGVGFLVGPRIGFSLFIGAVIGWGVLAPVLGNAQVIESVAYPNVKNWTMWAAIGLMVTSGILSLFLQIGAILRSFRSMKKASLEDRNCIEISAQFWFWAMVIVALIIAIIMQLIFDIPIWMTLLAILISYLLSIIAIRAYGETDINPVGAMGYSTQIIYGGISPGNMLTNIMTAGITASGANQAADMMQDFKTGYLLGATPKRQTYAQLFGVIVGSLLAVPLFFTVISAYGLSTEFLPAPSAVAWSGMAELLSKGFSSLPAYAGSGILIAAFFGIILTLLGKLKWRNFIPSPFAIGIGLFLPAFISLTIFLGSILKLVLDKRYPQWMKAYTVPLASGSIIGEAIIGIVVSVLMVWGIL